MAQPVRTCRGCGRRLPQDQLLRLALDGGLVRPDPDRRLPGRGAYICRRRDCARKLWQGRQKDRIFRGRQGAGAWDDFLERPEISSLPLADVTF
jgi:predicted RNA-binding protein YlxR (DUF448 family)